MISYSEIQEIRRRIDNCRMFDEMLQANHEGDFISFHNWVVSTDCKMKFEKDLLHECFLKDFIYWSKKRRFIWE